MSEIKVGEWIEVTRPIGRDEKLGIYKGIQLEVLSVNYDGDVNVLSPAGETVEILESQLKKVETPKKERVASGHYQNANNNDVWQFADDNLSEERVKGFHQVNAIKYVTRYHIKHDTMEKRIEDLEKAKVYIDKLIELERQA